MAHHFAAVMIGVACLGLPGAQPRGADGRAAQDTRPGVRAIDFDREPAWAYGFQAPPKAGDRAEPQPPPGRSLRPGEDPTEQTRPRRVPGSNRTYSLVDVRDLHNVVDWFPDDHPPMPNVVAHGPSRMGDLGRGCGSCHLPNGKGRPENAPIAGLPSAYLVRQIDDFRSGRRHSADPRKPNTYTMIALAGAMTDDEVVEAARYFGAMKWAPWVRLVERSRVPNVRLVDNLFLRSGQPGTEPVGDRIVEMPENEQQAEMYRNPRSGFVAFAPRGSVPLGRDLIDRGADGKPSGARTIPCRACHGAELTGLNDAPPLAARSPSYIVRQMWDVQQGARNGSSAEVMKVVVANLAPDDMRTIAAYLASRRLR